MNVGVVKMKKQLIELEKLDGLLEDYNKMKNKGEDFSDFIRVSKCLFDDKPALFDWVLVNQSDLIDVRECIDCGKTITTINAKRCKICSNHLKRNKPLSKEHLKNLIKANKKRTGTKHSEEIKDILHKIKSFEMTAKKDIKAGQKLRVELPIEEFLE
jgi:hypothetical protein